jgi:hypothetical protein
VDGDVLAAHDLGLPDRNWPPGACPHQPADRSVQDNRIVKVTSPLGHDVGNGHLCVKGRFGFEFVQRRARES